MKDWVASIKELVIKHATDKNKVMFHMIHCQKNVSSGDHSI